MSNPERTEGGLVEALRRAERLLRGTDANSPVPPKRGTPPALLRDLAEILSILAQIPTRPGWANALTPAEREALRWLRERVR